MNSSNGVGFFMCFTVCVCASAFNKNLVEYWGNKQVVFLFLNLQARYGPCCLTGSQ